VLQLARAVVPAAHGGEGLLDDRPRLRGKLVVLERRLVFVLDIILAALDFLDDLLVAVAGNCVLEIEPAAVCGGLQRAIVLGSAAQAPDLALSCWTQCRRSAA
jgi:hypothetical protein